VNFIMDTYLILWNRIQHNFHVIPNNRLLRLISWFFFYDALKLGTSAETVAASGSLQECSQWKIENPIFNVYIDFSLAVHTI
jgi:hypothetical protein